MQKYNIWMQGYLCSGMEGIPEKATYKGEFEVNSFKEACDMWSKTLKEPHYYNSEYLTYWGCKLFDNEVDARKSFG